MAFDQTTRNRLARFVSDARALLTEEFTRQLQHEYGLDPDSGEVTPIERLTALDDERRETALILRETMDYYLAGQQVTTRNRQEVLDRIVREQAFTVLNRLCALRMSEARGLVLESIAKGYQSQGFQLYARLVGSALGETGEAYRSYFFSIMDEFAVDLPVLFDRFSPQGRLFPRETVLLKLLELINDPEIEPLWTEDETIGWVYQYFNSKEERKAMRDASQAPRNSRELAVRNQFFTPRYVVEFLTDNTLGRIWYEMTRGETTLKDTCRYLVRRPNEIFLDEGEEALEQAETGGNLSQEELLRQSVYIPHRPLKDPREIKMLDPACGSMHFGLYAFDLFEQIYAEAWELEGRLGDDALLRLADLEPLHKTYLDKDAYLKDVPRLIIECNIHGVDIDPRAVQIAGLSLWLRAQKSWQAQGLRPAERPQICKSNVVCAEPMPGDRQMLDEFLGTLRGERLEALMRKTWHVSGDEKVRSTPQMAEALGKLVRKVWDEMELAGEAGSLLKIEETLRDAIANARKESEEKSPLFRVLEYGLNEPPKEKYVQLLAGKDQDFFDRAEGLVLKALSEYAEQAVNGNSYRRRLFIGDAVQGFAFIDLCRKRYDLIVMNPPFGELPEKVISYLRNEYINLSENLYCGFLIRANEISTQNGLVGAITDRSYLVKQSFEGFRKLLLTTKCPFLIVDLGWGVLDANVETCTTVLNSESQDCLYLDIGNSNSDKEQQIYESCNAIENWQFESLKLFINMPYTAFSFKMPIWVRKGYLNPQNRVDKSLFRVVRGMAGSNSDYLYRNIYEVNPREIGNAKKWVFLQKGSPYSPFYYPPEYLLLHEGAKFSSVLSYDSGRITSNEYYEKPGLSFGKRTDLMYAFVMNKEQIFSVEGQAIFPFDESQIWQCLAIINSSPFQLTVNTVCGQHKLHGYLNAVHISSQNIPDCSVYAKNIYSILQGIDRFNELSSIFIKPLALSKEINSSLFLTIENLIVGRKIELENVRKMHLAINSQIANALGAPNNIIEIGIDANYISNLFGQNGSAWDELHNVFSWFIGCLFGRWDFRNFSKKLTDFTLPNSFDQLPVCALGMLQNSERLPVLPQEAPRDYPLRIFWNGIIVDDENNKDDIDLLLHQLIEIIWCNSAETIEQEAYQIFTVHSLREYFQKPTLFFSDHLQRYSKSRRASPIYWPLSTPPGSYTIWLYYHRLNDQTLYTCVNDFVDPKLKQVSDETARLRLKKGRSAADEKELERLTDFERELKDFREELLRVAKFWKPNLNDGVEITAAPLWKLFQHKPWQKRLRETWQKLEAGEYDWAHLAYSIWPERVREKCKTDKSLAIAHDLEALYVELPASTRKKNAKQNMKLDDQFDNEA
jgi:hypothetical protein